MDVFNRKKLAEAEKELARMKEQYDRTVENDRQTIERYIQKLNEAQDYIDELKNEKHEKAEKKDIYHIHDTVIQKPKYISAVYRSTKSLLTPNEHKLFKQLCEIILEIEQEKSVKLVIFSKLRLADIINLWEEDYNNPTNTNQSFFHCKEKNRYKQQICDEIKEIKPDFDNNDYKETFLYPLLKRHFDFVICSADEVMPFLVIELHGDEHETDFKTKKSDELKKSLLDATKVDLLIIKNKDLTDTKFVKAIVLGKICECLARLNA